MKRFEEKTQNLLLGSSALVMSAVGVADYFAPLGVAVFILYTVAVALAFFAWKPAAPLAMALLATVLVAVDFQFTPDGDDRDIARLNRVFGVIAMWMVAGIGHKFIRNRLEARRESWLQAGQALISEQLIGELEMGELGDNVLRYFADYTGARAGAIFIAEGEEFRRFATYGAAGESVPEGFFRGEGLLGQAAKDRRVMVVDDVPEGYLSVASGLGGALPRHLLILPVKLKGAVGAVMELGYFQPVSPIDRQLFERVESSIAVAIRSVAYRRRLQELLEETQQQTEEVQAQSEELRVSNEELEEQSRALRESQSRLELQQTELEQINTQLEEQAIVLERQKKELLDTKRILESQAREVEQASRYKSDFLANMSHELRTPLNSSLILAKLLAENRAGNLTAEQVKYAQTIESSGSDLLVLINDVLDLSKIEAGHMEIHAEPLRIENVVSGLRDTFDPVARQKGVGLTMTVSDAAPRRIVSDSQRLVQVLKNLLSNALKFTDRGTVALTVEREADGRIAFAVSDTGIGIAEDQQRTVFSPFFQGDGTTSRKYGGTGLGLSISSNLARLLGGEIRLSSEPGKGSVFTLLIPENHDGPAPDFEPAEVLAPVDHSTAEDLPGSTTLVAGLVPDDRDALTGNGRVILAVEDDESFARIIYDLAREMSFRCLVATSAEEGLALAKEHLPSAIVLDVGLPDNSGLIVLERLKSDSRTRHIPVHVVSASDYTQTAMALGAVGYMLKPVKREQLAEAFQRLEDRLSQGMRRVLVVEDDPAQIEAMKGLLGSRDVETVCAPSAADCLNHLRTETFDCMVLDLSLPDASGFSLLETLSEEDAYSFPPVIVYTGRELSGREEQQLRKYSRSIIIKGAKSHERLLDEVSLFLHQVVSELPPEKQRMLEKSGNRDAALEGRRVLVVEDDVRNIFALTSLLEGRGMKLTIARNGREALEALEKSLADPGSAVDLVLMDIMMPEMDGLTAMREIRKRREWLKLPIVALTAKAMKSDQEECLAAGANDFLAKPLDVEKLLSLIRVWMPR